MKCLNMLSVFMVFVLVCLIPCIRKEAKEVGVNNLFLNYAFAKA